MYIYVYNPLSVQMMHDFRGMTEFEVDGEDFAGLECLGFGSLEIADEEDITQQPENPQ